MVTPDNGDPAFTVYVVFENSTTNDDFNAINTLNYALVSEMPLISCVNYSISNQSSDGTVAYSNFSSMQLCFGTGTRIRAAGGDVPIEVLRPVDRVWTLDHGLQPVLWISHTMHRWGAAPARDKPILFAQCTWGDGLPRRDLVVSAQHRILVPDSGAGVLCPAKGMTRHSGVRQMQGCREIELVHLLLAQHQIIEAEGVATERFYPGRNALRALTRDQRAEIANVLGLAKSMPLSVKFKPARRFLSVRQTRGLLEGGTNTPTVHCGEKPIRASA